MPVQIHDISHTFGERLILDHISLTVHAGERVGIVGNNGAGKSTLLQIIAGGRASDYGHVSYDPATEIGYLPQTVAALPGQSIADLLSQARQRIIALEQQLQHLASQLTTATGAEQTALLHTYGEVAARFELAGGYELDYRIAMVLYGLGLGHLAPGRLLETLSGGEKTRVALAALLLGVPDLLLLDEPTNHLDAAAADWLERYLIEQPGAVLVVSHDRRLLDRVATRIIELDEHSHQISSYGGNYSAYRQHKERERQAWVERYAREQAEIADLRQQLATRPQRTGALRTPRRDHDKLSYHLKASACNKPWPVRYATSNSDSSACWPTRCPNHPCPCVFALRLSHQLWSRAPCCG
ncbi:MAG: ABC-F family ATP-binding cassette domain-containing protein [Chloroflexaceae bacterium]|nr:ABC-F family ATP-binding cassette domain-containing protein [Chloroflexaceae bacterium]